MIAHHPAGPSAILRLSLHLSAPGTKKPPHAHHGGMPHLQRSLRRIPGISDPADHEATGPPEGRDGVQLVC
jgi:hypothetical protein